MREGGRGYGKGGPQREGRGEAGWGGSGRPRGLRHRLEGWWLLATAAPRGCCDDPNGSTQRRECAGGVPRGARPGALRRGRPCRPGEAHPSPATHGGRAPQRPRRCRRGRHDYGRLCRRRCLQRSPLPSSGRGGGMPTLGVRGVTPPSPPGCIQVGPAVRRTRPPAAAAAGTVFCFFSRRHAHGRKKTEKKKK